MATATINTRSIQGETLSAATDRLANVVMREGVIDLNRGTNGSYAVKQDTGANMQIKVGSGSAFDRAVVEGDFSGQATFVCEHQNATQTLTIAASDPTNDRIDNVILRVRDDTFDSSGLDEADIEVTTGTPAASPSAPAVPSTAIKLAEVLVQSSVTAITNSDITDFRYEAPTRGQLIETVYFTSSGSFVKADYPWLHRVIAKVQAGGGAGGGTGATASGASAAAGGGGGGGYAEGLILSSALSASETVTVGGGGAGAAGATGGTGGNSSFGAHVAANGGVGGGSDAGVTVFSSIRANGTAGSVGTAGDLLISGGAGSFGIVLASTGNGAGRSGQGGDAMLGPGGLGVRDSAAGAAPTSGYGGAGSGAVRIGQHANPLAGGDGADGVVILELYA